jgi:hypothetical protein
MLRASAVGLALAALAGAPLALALGAAEGARALALDALAGARAAVAAVGVVLVPQALFAVAIAGLWLERVAARAAGLAAPEAPWLDPAIESCLLLGMLGTMSGMLQAFAGAELASLDAGFLVHCLGTALRSSYVGFGIALAGVWAKARCGPERA